MLDKITSRGGCGEPIQTISSGTTQPWLGQHAARSWGQGEGGHRGSQQGAFPQSLCSPSLAITQPWAGGGVEGSMGRGNTDTSLMVPVGFPHQLQASCWLSQGCADPKAPHMPPASSRLSAGPAKAMWTLWEASLLASLRHHHQLQTACWLSQDWTDPEGSVYVGSLCQSPSPSLPPPPVCCSCELRLDREVVVWQSWSLSSLPELPSSQLWLLPCCHQPGCQACQDLLWKPKLWCEEGPWCQQGCGSMCLQSIGGGLGLARLGHP